MASLTELDERRKARRFSVGWNIVLKGYDKMGSEFAELGSLINLSSRGAFLRLHKNFSVGSKLEMWIKVPLEDERWMVYSAEVVRCETHAPETHLGMKFTKLRPKLVSIL